MKTLFRFQRALLLLIALCAIGGLAHAAETVLYDKPSKYNNIIVTEDDEGLRVLRFEKGGARQTIAKPGKAIHAGQAFDIAGISYTIQAAARHTATDADAIYLSRNGVATGIVSHHGDGIMRFFYEKARSQSGEDVNPDDFRHIGHKPRTAETAIVMLADSLEAACRAHFQTEEPTPQAIEKVVDRVIDEKLNDDQLSESPLTLAELTAIRSAFLDSLVGHYHQRIAYPNFPGT